jgi:hypothetical protein
MGMGEKVCSVEGCDRQAIAQAWCRKHYQRWYRFGDPGIASRVEAER